MAKMRDDAGNTPDGGTEPGRRVKEARRRRARSAGIVAGTVLYMAQEQPLGVRHSSPASDQHSLAAVLYEAVTKTRRLAPDGSVYEIMERVRTICRAHAERYASSPRPGFDAVVLRAMQHDPTNALRERPRLRARSPVRGRGDLSCAESSEISSAPDSGDR